MSCPNDLDNVYCDIRIPPNLYYGRVVNCAFLIVPVPKMRVLVYIKVVVYFISVFAMLGWTVSLAGGSIQSPPRSVTLDGSQRSWIIAKFFFLGLASCGTFISNAADLQRYARRPNDVIIGQLLSFPISNMLIAILGNLIACASQNIFGEVSSASDCGSI